MCVCGEEVQNAFQGLLKKKKKRKKKEFDGESSTGNVEK